MVSLRGAALAGMVGAVVFAAVVIFLTLAQYGFMIGLGWKPLELPTCPGRAAWPWDLWGGCRC